MTARKVGWKRDPDRRRLPVAGWPIEDQQAWAALLRPGTVLDEGGTGDKWAPATRAGMAALYGRWLSWLALTGHLDATIRPADRVTPVMVAHYVADLQQLNAPSTVHLAVVILGTVVSAMSPARDWQWLWDVTAQLKSAAGPVRDKLHRLVPVQQLQALGLELMEAAEASAVAAPWRRAVRFRDGLMVALMAARPLRMRNFTGIELDQHLVRTRTGYRLHFGAYETKNGRRLDFAFPTGLLQQLDRYLSIHRPVLCARAGLLTAGPQLPYTGKRLWVSGVGTEMQAASIYARIIEMTERRFGTSVHPHLFRDCAATSIALEAPDQTSVAAAILGHSSVTTAERYYNHARAVQASGLYQTQLLATRQHLKHTARPKPAPQRRETR